MGRRKPAAPGEAIKCPYSGCPKILKSHMGLTYHVNSIHRNLNAIPNNPIAANDSPPGLPIGDDDDDDAPPPYMAPRSQKNYHPFLDGRPCDEFGEFLPEGTPPPPRTTAPNDDWPYDSSVQFNIADFLFRRVQMSAGNIDFLLEQWALSMMQHGDLGPFQDYQHLYETIDSTKLGDAPWQCLQTEPLALGEDAPIWARQSYEIWYRDPETVIANMLFNPDSDGTFDTAPYVHLDADGNRRWHDFMSANFAWRHSGSRYTPLFFGADKTIVSVATGDVEYHPGYLSLGNIYNTMRRGHRNGVAPFIFFAIPKGDRKYDNDPEFRKFKKQLYHASLAAVLSSLKPGMKTPVVRRCPDGHFRRSDYPEQVMLAAIVQNWCAKCVAFASCTDINLDGDIAGRRTHELTEELLSAFDPYILWDEYGIDADIIPFTQDFPRADIHEMLSPDLLHQIIKGTFKDHLVTWVGEYINIKHEKAEADAIMDEIDCRYNCCCTGLRQFKQGRRFKQWTGDDSKALMKVYLAAIKGLVPPAIVEALSAFLDFRYLVRRADFDESTLDAIDAAVLKHHERREVFRDLKVRDHFSLPRQHSVKHYRINIEDFGAPGGVCSSITESRHITAVKKPWRRSSRHKALSQMLLTNQRLDKLAASRADFIERGMLPPVFAAIPEKIPKDEEAEEIDEPRVEGNIINICVLERSYPRLADALGDHIGLPAFPHLLTNFLHDQLHSDKYADSDDDDLDISEHPLSVFHSALATFYAPSDPSGIRGMRRERIRSTPSWGKHGLRRDCAFVVENQTENGFRGMSAVHMKGRSRLTTIVHLDTLLRGAHLIPVYGTRHIPANFRYQHSLDAFKAFHVNKYIDHHANEIAF
ncbi:hypothetical protein B0H14DRAFT_3696876 [Mycena olivaceomarginata]|nr:hypothetical protein B0H14DRAFT_3696876 [Mycena olivaceomarginata]